MELQSGNERLGDGERRAKWAERGAVGGQFVFLSEVKGADAELRDIPVAFPAGDGKDL